jgi:hypothetical protein
MNHSPREFEVYGCSHTYSMRANPLFDVSVYVTVNKEYDKGRYITGHTHAHRQAWVGTHMRGDNSVAAAAHHQSRAALSKLDTPTSTAEPATAAPLKQQQQQQHTHWVPFGNVQQSPRSSQSGTHSHKRLATMTADRRAGRQLRAKPAPPAQSS